MLDDIRLPNARGDDRYVRRIVRALDSRRLGAVALVPVLLSLGPLAGSELLDFFPPAAIALPWLEHVAPLLVYAGTLTPAYTPLHPSLWRHGRPTRHARPPLLVS